MQQLDTIPMQLDQLLNDKTAKEKADLIFRIHNEHIEIWSDSDPVYHAFINKKINWGPAPPPFENWYGTWYDMPGSSMFGLQRIGVLYNEDGRRYDICRLLDE